MKYFNYELISAANDWVKQSRRQFRNAQRRFEKTAKAYSKLLKSLQGAVPKAAWNFFMYGNEEESLHDASLLSFKVQGLTLDTKQLRKVWSRPKRTRAKIEFVGYGGDFICAFEAIDVYWIHSTLFSEGPTKKNTSLGMLFTYELTRSGRDSLQLNFLFDSGAEIEVQFKKLKFQKVRLKPRQNKS